MKFLLVINDEDRGLQHREVDGEDALKAALDDEEPLHRRQAVLEWATREDILAGDRLTVSGEVLIVAVSAGQPARLVTQTVVAYGPPPDPPRKAPRKPIRAGRDDDE